MHFVRYVLGKECMEHRSKSLKREEKETQHWPAWGLWFRQHQTSPGFMSRNDAGLAVNTTKKFVTAAVVSDGYEMLGRDGRGSIWSWKLKCAVDNSKNTLGGAG